MRGRSATVHAINHMIVKAILSLRFCNHQNEYKTGNFTLSYLGINDVLFEHWTETIIYGDWYTPTLDFRLPLFTLVIFFKCIEYKYIKYKCVQKNNCILLYCNQISLCLKYGREKGINEICTCQGHIYLVCFKNHFFFTICKAQIT